MKRLLLSACLVGVMFAGLSPSPKSMQGEPASDPLNVAYAATPVSGVSLAEPSPSIRAFSRLRFALQRSALFSPTAHLWPALTISLRRRCLRLRSRKRLPRPATPGSSTKAPCGWSSPAGPGCTAARRFRHRWSAINLPARRCTSSTPRKAGTRCSTTDGKRGWVYAKYYLEPIDRPGQKRVAVVQAPQAPINAAPWSQQPHRRPCVACCNSRGSLPLRRFSRREPCLACVPLAMAWQVFSPRLPALVGLRFFF